MSTSTQTARLKVPDGPLLAQLAGMREARAWGERLAADMAQYRARRLAWSEIDPGCVLHGPPGTGKTTFAQALAASCKVPLLATSYAAWDAARATSSVTAAMQRDFETARANAPCILFIDELDSLPSRTIGNHNQDWWTAVVNALLEQLDGVTKREGVIVIAACNHPDRLDPALVRSARLDQMIHIPLPALEDLPDILRFHLGGEADRAGDLASLAVLCVGSTGADIKKLVREARSRARGRGLERKDLIAAIEAHAPKASEDEVHRIAVHETGHAVVAKALLDLRLDLSIMPNRPKVGPVIVGRGDAFTRSDVERRLAVLMAGRVAEEVVTGTASGLAGGGEDSDLAVATRLASQAVRMLGLSATGALSWLGDRVGSAAHAEEVETMLHTAAEHAREVLAVEFRRVHAIVARLVREKAIPADAVFPEPVYMPIDLRYNTPVHTPQDDDPPGAMPMPPRRASTEAGPPTLWLPDAPRLRFPPRRRPAQK